MSIASKPFLLLAAGLTVCLAGGLWLQHEFAIRSARWEAETVVADELERLLGSSVDPADWEAGGTSLPEHVVLARLHPGENLVEVLQPPAVVEAVAHHPLRWERNGDGSGAERLHLQAGQVRQQRRAFPAVKRHFGDEQYVLFWNQWPVPPSAASLEAAMVSSSLLAFVWTLGLQLIAGYLILARIRAQQAERKQHFEQQAVQSSRELVRTRDAVIFGLAKLAESRDPDTGLHLERITQYSVRLAEGLRRHPRFQQVVTPAFIRLLEISSALHDIGKVGVEDAILLKPGKLTEDERFRMQLHAVMGGSCIAQIQERLAGSNFLEMAREIAYHHHEWWDGTGYPARLAGEDIPLAARIVAVADVYDALRSKRTYKEEFSHEECVTTISAEAGTHFDPGIVEVFLEIHPQFNEISRTYSELSHATFDNLRKALERTPHPANQFPEHLQQVLLASLDECDAELRNADPRNSRKSPSFS